MTTVCTHNMLYITAEVFTMNVHYKVTIRETTRCVETNCDTRLHACHTHTIQTLYKNTHMHTQHSVDT